MGVGDDHRKWAEYKLRPGGVWLPKQYTASQAYTQHQLGESGKWVGENAI